MAFSLRRVVTGHDASGRAVVTSDSVLEAAAPRPGQEACTVWADPVPADNEGGQDGALRVAGSRLPGGAVFRIVCHGPGANGNLHRTRTTDYGIVLSGQIELELDDGAVVGLAAGDVLVQRGTVHRWRNPAAEPCTIAFVLLDALPLGAN
jgi:quercetin dioxygenase-like cupin family protein